MREPTPDFLGVILTAPGGPFEALALGFGSKLRLPLDTCAVTQELV